MVVKVQRPGVYEQVERDLEILSGMAGWAEENTVFGRDHDLPGLVDEFASTRIWRSPHRTRLSSASGGETYYFCGTNCKDKFDADPAAYADAQPDNKRGGCC